MRSTIAYSNKKIESRTNANHKGANVKLKMQRKLETWQSYVKNRRGSINNCIWFLVSKILFTSVRITSKTWKSPEMADFA